MNRVALCLALFFLSGLCGIAANAQETGTSNQPASREEQERLAKEIESLKAQIEALTKEIPQAAETAQTIEELEKELKAVKEKAEASQPGSTKFLMTGYGFAGLADHQGESSTFFAGLNPIFLWKLGDRIFFEGELELELEGSETAVALEYANVWYVLNDYVTVRAGKFLTPLSTFKEKLHPAWINKLPDQPLFVIGSTRLIPTSSLGIEIRGAVPAGPTKFNYALYLSNGPRLNTTGSEAGTLAFNNFEDLNNNKAVGGRIGLLPIPELEVAYALKIGRVGPEGTPYSDVDARIQQVSISYVRSSDALKGTVDLRAEWIWSKVDEATYGSLRFKNERDGGYLQLAYRPSGVEQKFLKNLEAVARYDALDLPEGAPIQVDQRRWTAGLNYWLGPSTLVKAAYQSNQKEEPQSESERERGFLFQFAIGF